MIDPETKQTIENGIKGIEAIAGIVMKNAEQLFSKMSPEDAANFAKALNDSNIEKQVSEAMEQLRQTIRKHE